jgi:hypothetical protein
MKIEMRPLVAELAINPRELVTIKLGHQINLDDRVTLTSG